MNKITRNFFDSILLAIIYILLTIVIYFVIAFLWEGYNERKVYSLSSCSNVCQDRGYSQSACLWISERKQGMQNIGSCKVVRSNHCGKDGQCSCMCSNKNSLFKYSSGVEPEKIYSKNLNVFYIHAKATTTPGYSWQIDYDPNYLELVERIGKDKYSKDGKGGTVTFKFNTINSGKTKVYLYYRLPWQEEVTPRKVQVYEVLINHFLRSIY